MIEPDEVPLLLELLFGDTADTAWRGASERLRIWAEAFEKWMEERSRKYKPATVQQTKAIWRQVLQRQGKMPWEMEQVDIEAHVAGMEAEGYSKMSVHKTLSTVTHFYDWCDERRIDAECEAGFNPAAGVERPKIKDYEDAPMLSPGEVGRLLRILERDESTLGKRDYVLFLARMRTGVPLRYLQRLQWGQIEVDDEGAYARWRPEGERARLPEDAWGAMQDWLTASGRLDGMREADYIFTPLAQPELVGEKDSAEDWASERYMTVDNILKTLKLYGKRVVIEPEKLTLQALRRTAIRLRMDQDRDLDIQAMKVFLDSEDDLSNLKYRLGKLPQMPDDGGEVTAAVVVAPNRQPIPFPPGYGQRHGFYALSQPEAGVLAVLKEGIEGTGYEIAGLRILGRELVRRQLAVRSSKEAVKLADAMTMTAARMATLINTEEKLAGEESSNDVLQEHQEMIYRIRTVAVELGLSDERVVEKPTISELRADLLGEDEGLSISRRSLAEEVATVRYMLRNVLVYAMEAEETTDFVRYADIYGKGCVRLVQMLRRDGSDVERLRQAIKKRITDSIKRVADEFGLE
jgi:site-specific recombinase XerC